MEYSDLASFERLTGLGFFTQAGQAAAISLGNITMLKVDYSTKSVDDLVSLRGRLTIRRRNYFQASPVFSIDGNQFASPLIPLLLLGAKISDLIQAAATAATFTFTAEAGSAYLLGVYGATNIVVTVGGGSPKIQGTDYFLDDPNVPQTSAISHLGAILLPVNPQGISDGDAVTVTFNQPDLVMDQYQAFTDLDRLGQLAVFAEDESGIPGAREIWLMSVSLSCKKAADIDPANFRKFTLEAAILGNPTVLKPSQTALADELMHLGVGGDTFSWS